MADNTERITATTTLGTAPAALFAVLADPSTHADIGGTGSTLESLDGERITTAGQVFRMAMYHPNHPDRDYKIANRVEAFDEPWAIAWQPGQESPETGKLSFGDWIWRYDLKATGPSQTTVTLTYDWPAVPPHIREHLEFPPFPARPPRQLTTPPVPPRRLDVAKVDSETQTRPFRRRTT